MAATSIDPRLDARLAAYIEHVRAWCRAGPPTRERIELLRAHAAELVREPLAIPRGFRNVPEHGYGRNRLHTDAEHGFMVLAMVWPPGVGGAPHDHGTWGVVAIAEGEIEVVDYTERPIPGTNDRVELHERGRVVGSRGATAFVLPPHEDLHRVRNASTAKPALSIHTYGREIRRCRVFDERTGAVSFGAPEYHETP